jgi:hypothetical protein
MNDQYIHATSTSYILEDNEILVIISHLHIKILMYGAPLKLKCKISASQKSFSISLFRMYSYESKPGWESDVRVIIR